MLVTTFKSIAILKFLFQYHNFRCPLKQTIILFSARSPPLQCSCAAFSMKGYSKQLQLWGFVTYISKCDISKWERLGHQTQQVFLQCSLSCGVAFGILLSPQVEMAYQLLKTQHPVATMIVIIDQTHDGSHCIQTCPSTHLPLSTAM